MGEVEFKIDSSLTMRTLGRLAIQDDDDDVRIGSSSGGVERACSRRRRKNQLKRETDYTPLFPNILNGIVLTHILKFGSDFGFGLVRLHTVNREPCLPIYHIYEEIVVFVLSHVTFIISYPVYISSFSYSINF